MNGHRLPQSCTPGYPTTAPTRSGATPTLLGLVAMALVSALPASAYAQSAPHTLGDHPAVVAKRLEAGKGYDYGSKFYPHPAWLYLHAVPPEDPMSSAHRSQAGMVPDAAETLEAHRLRSDADADPPAEEPAQAGVRASSKVERHVEHE